MILHGLHHAPRPANRPVNGWVNESFLKLGMGLEPVNRSEDKSPPGFQRRRLELFEECPDDPVVIGQQLQDSSGRGGWLGHATVHSQDQHKKQPTIFQSVVKLVGTLDDIVRPTMS